MKIKTEMQQINAEISILNKLINENIRLRDIAYRRLRRKWDYGVFAFIRKDIQQLDDEHKHLRETTEKLKDYMDVLYDMCKNLNNVK